MSDDARRAQALLAHKGDPCLYCKVPHDDVPIGPCLGHPAYVLAIKWFVQSWLYQRAAIWPVEPSLLNRAVDIATLVRATEQRVWGEAAKECQHMISVADSAIEGCDGDEFIKLNAICAAFTDMSKWCRDQATKETVPEPVQLGPSCNLHRDCQLANEQARARGKRAEHCHDEDCKDCFGC